ncbi:MAG: class A beta-lactamase [Rhodospirillaceae bacterium]|nr:class A beta-lactamase [Rhodospirillaceae bacterium]
MTLLWTRRGFAALAGSAVAAPSLLRAQPEDGFAAAAKAIEARLPARLGVFARDTGSGRHWAYRADERFPLCSTFKALAAGALLARVDAGRERLDRRIRYGAGDLVSYSPVTQKHVGAGMTLAALCEAAVTLSDNTAGNLILKSIGGPAGLTAFLRRLGDAKTRLDRWETALNSAIPGDPRDTTTPRAMAGSLAALVLGDRLSLGGRAQLAAWLRATKTGDAKLRAGVPKGWRVGDKTGGGGHGAMGDVAILWPPGRKPIVVAVYLTETAAGFDARNGAIAGIARALAAAAGA